MCVGLGCGVGAARGVAASQSRGVAHAGRSAASMLNAVRARLALCCRKIPFPSRPICQPSLRILVNNYTVQHFKLLHTGTMAYDLRLVGLNDIEDLVRLCDYPAIQQNPLNMTMFPNSSPETKEEEILWHISSFRESFEDGHEVFFRKVCTSDNSPVGFAMWILDQTGAGLQTSRTKTKAEAPPQTPTSLDVCAWRSISRQLSSERQRALKGLTDVWRKFPLRGVLVSRLK